MPKMESAKGRIRTSPFVTVHLFSRRTSQADREFAVYRFLLCLVVGVAVWIAVWHEKAKQREERVSMTRT